MPTREGDQDSHASPAQYFGFAGPSAPMFLQVWMRGSGLGGDRLRGRNMPLVFAGSFVLSLIIAFNLAAFLIGHKSLSWGRTAGALAGVGWVATAFGITYLFEGRSVKLFLVNAGYLPSHSW